MNNRIANYKSVKGREHEKSVTFRFEKNRKIEVSCLDKQYVNKNEQEDKIVGNIHIKNKKYTGKEYATLNGIDEKQIDIYSKKKIYERTVGYVLTKDDEYLAVVKPSLLIIILFGLMLIGLVVGLLFAIGTNNHPTDPDNPIIEPSGEVEDAPEEIDADIVHITLPDGVISFDEKTDAKDGVGNIRISMKVDGKEHILIPKREITITDGVIQDLEIDFRDLDFEIKPGVYDGEAIITYLDGTTHKLILKCFVVSKTSGTIDISYSDKVKVELESGLITLYYSPSNASKKSKVQVILINDGREYILAESVDIKDRQSLVSLTLDDSMKSRLVQGIYSGIIRVYMDGNSTDVAANIHTDIEVSISVYD